jgi:hypothetical protein
MENLRLVSNQQELAELRAINRLMYEEYVSQNKVQMNYSDGSSESISVEKNYTKVFEGLIGKDIDAENLDEGCTIWKMSASKDVRISRHDHPNIELYFVSKGEIVELVGNVVTKANEVHKIAKEKAHDILIKAGTIFIIKWEPRMTNI